MDSIEQVIQIRFRYRVHFTRGLFDPENLLLRQTLGEGKQTPAKALFVVDSGLYDARPDLLDSIRAYCDSHRDAVEQAGEPLICPGGEDAKNTPCYARAVHEAVHRLGICRQSFIVAIGGGAVLDMAGYAAATAHRGVRLIRVPTTVLSQNDSGVGVKNGINDFGKKNFLGSFAPPWAVLNDSEFLETLTRRDWVSGISEAVKVGLIKDRKFFDWIEGHASALLSRDSAAMEYLIRRCAALHLEHIANAGDPFEMGSSRPLDFGHWAAHKLEQLTGFGLRHGEAVAIGIALDCTYSWLAGRLPEREWRRILNLLRGLDLPIYIPELGEHLSEPAHPRSVLQGLSEFREHLGGELTVLLLEAAGKPFEVHEIDTGLVREAARVLEAVTADGGLEVESLCRHAAKGA